MADEQPRRPRYHRRSPSPVTSPAAPDSPELIGEIAPHSSDDEAIQVTRALATIEKIKEVNRQAEKGIADLAYIAEPLPRMHIPMSKPPSSLLIYERRDGRKRLKIVGHPEYGLPYGSDDLRIMAGAVTLYKEQGSSVLRFNPVADMLRYFGFSTNKRGYDEAAASLRRLAGCQIEIIEEKDDKGRRYTLKYGKIFKEVTLWRDLPPEQMRLDGKGIEIVLADEFAKFIKTNESTGFEWDRLKHLRSSPGESQLFIFLRARSAALEPKEIAYIPIHGPNSIESQLGWLPGKLPKPEKVRWFIKTWIAKLRSNGFGIWPECPGEVIQGNDGNWRLKIWNVPGPNGPKQIE